MDKGPEVELLCGLRRDYWGFGLATEASRAVLTWLWEWTRLQRVFARTDPPNHKSVAVMERLGMRFHSATAGLITYVMERSSGEPIE